MNLPLDRLLSVLRLFAGLVFLIFSTRAAASVACSKFFEHRDEGFRGVSIPHTSRPEGFLERRHRPPDSDETTSAGTLAQDPLEIRSALASGRYFAGTFVIIVVRTPSDHDVVLYAPRLAEGEDFRQARFNTHRSLLTRYSERTGDASPRIVAGGECLVAPNSLMLRCLSRMGTAPDPRNSVEYLADAAVAAGFVRDVSTQLRRFDPAAESMIGHMRAREEARWAAYLTEHLPGLIEAVDGIERWYFGSTGLAGISLRDRIRWTRAEQRTQSTDVANDERRGVYVTLFQVPQVIADGPIYAASRLLTSENPAAFAFPDGPPLDAAPPNLEQRLSAERLLARLRLFLLVMAPERTENTLAP